MVTVFKRKIGRLGCLVGLILVGVILSGVVFLVLGLLGVGKHRANAILRIARAERPIAFYMDTAASTDRDRFDIYKATQQQLVVSRFVLLAALRDPAVARLPIIRRVQENRDPVVWLQRQICVHFPGKAELMEVSIALGHSDSQEAATLVNGVVNAYLHEVVNAELDQRRQHLAELDKAVAENEQQVRTKREVLSKLAAEMGTSDTGAPSPKQKLLLADLTSARQESFHMKSELRRMKAELAAQKSLQSSDVFSKLREEVKAEKLATVQAEVKRLETAIAVTTTEQQDLERETQQMQKEAEKFGVTTVDMAMLQTDIKNAETVLAALRTERDKVKVEHRRAPRIQLLVPAQASDH